MGSTNENQSRNKILNMSLPIQSMRYLGQKAKWFGLSRLPYLTWETAENAKRVKLKKRDNDGIPYRAPVPIDNTGFPNRLISSS